MSLAQQISLRGYAEALIVLKPGATPMDAVGAAAQLAPHFSLGQDAHVRDPKLLKNLRTELTARGLTASARPQSIEDVLPPFITYENLGLVIGTVDSAGLAAVRSSSVVAKVVSLPEISLIRPTVSTAVPPPKSEVTWGLVRLGVPDLWSKGLSGKGVLVGHLDTGVDASHPALKGAVSTFAEFDFSGQQKLGAKASDSGDHGTHTAGTIAGRAVKDAKGRLHNFGVAPKATLASGLVIEGGHVVRRILAGMNWVVGTGARILSMSLGLRGYDEGFLVVVRVLRDRGILPVIAVGNEGFRTSRSPGNYPEAVSIGASDRNDNVAGFSSSERFKRKADPLVPDFVAPGVDVLSCVPGKEYAEMSGTSMATPHVAGLAALLLEAVPAATVKQLEQALFASCRRPASMSPERGNRGIPSGPRALRELQKLVGGKAGGAKKAAAAAKGATKGAKKAKAKAKAKKAKGQAKKAKAAPKAKAA